MGSAVAVSPQPGNVQHGRQTPEHQFRSRRPSTCSQTSAIHSPKTPSSARLRKSIESQSPSRARRPSTDSQSPSRVRTSIDTQSPCRTFRNEYGVARLEDVKEPWGHWRPPKKEYIMRRKSEESKNKDQLSSSKVDMHAFASSNYTSIGRVADGLADDHGRPGVWAAIGHRRPINRVLETIAPIPHEAITCVVALDFNRIAIGNAGGHIIVSDWAVGNITGSWSASEGKITALVVRGGAREDGLTDFVSGDSTGEIAVWDTVGALRRTLTGHCEEICGLAVLSLPRVGSQFLASGSRDCTVRTWDLDEGTCLHSVHIVGGVTTALHPFSTEQFNVHGIAFVQTAEDLRLRLWGVGEKRQLSVRRVLSVSEEQVAAFDISPTGILVTGSRGRDWASCELAVWDLWKMEKLYNAHAFGSSIEALRIIRRTDCSAPRATSYDAQVQQEVFQLLAVSKDSCMRCFSFPDLTLLWEETAATSSPYNALSVESAQGGEVAVFASTAKEVFVWCWPPTAIDMHVAPHNQPVRCAPMDHPPLLRAYGVAGGTRGGGDVRPASGTRASTHGAAEVSPDSPSSPAPITMGNTCAAFGQVTASLAVTVATSTLQERDQRPHVPKYGRATMEVEPELVVRAREFLERPLPGDPRGWQQMAIAGASPKSLARIPHRTVLPDVGQPPGGGTPHMNSLDGLLAAVREDSASFDAKKRLGKVSAGPTRSAQRSRVVGAPPWSDTCKAHAREDEICTILEELDPENNGWLNLGSLRSYLRERLGYGEEEVSRFMRHAARSEGAGAECPTGECAGDLHGVCGAPDKISHESFRENRGLLNAVAIARQTGQSFLKRPGAIGWQQFCIEECEDCQAMACDLMERALVDQCIGCKVLLGPSLSATVIRDCCDCTFWVAARQVKIRGCTGCRFYLYSQTRPVMEHSSALSFAPWTGAYPLCSQHFQGAGFDPTMNFWNAVFDFTPSGSGSCHWSIVPFTECECLAVTFEEFNKESKAIPPDCPTAPLSHELLIAPAIETSLYSNHSMHIMQVQPPLPQPPKTEQRRDIVDMNSDTNELVSPSALATAGDTGTADPALVRKPTPPDSPPPRLPGQLRQRPGSGPRRLQDENSSDVRSSVRSTLESASKSDALVKAPEEACQEGPAAEDTLAAEARTPDSTSPRLPGQLRLRPGSGTGPRRLIFTDDDADSSMLASADAPTSPSTLARGGAGREAAMALSPWEVAATEPCFTANQAWKALKAEYLSEPRAPTPPVRGLGPDCKLEKDLLIGFARTKLNEVNILHLRILQSAWARLRNGFELPPRTSESWLEIGFQCTDPAMDLRGIGMLGLLHLLLFSELAPLDLEEGLKASHDESGYFPFAVASFSFSKLAVDLLMEGKLNSVCNKVRASEKPVSAIYLGAFRMFLKRWQTECLSIDDFGRVLKEISKLASSQPLQVLPDGILDTLAA